MYNVEWRRLGDLQHGELWCTVVSFCGRVGNLQVSAFVVHKTTILTAWDLAIYSSVCTRCTAVTGGDQVSSVFLVYISDWRRPGRLQLSKFMVYRSDWRRLGHLQLSVLKVHSQQWLEETWLSTAHCIQGVLQWLEETWPSIGVLMMYRKWLFEGDWVCLKFLMLMLYCRHLRLFAASRSGKLKLVFTATGFTGSCQLVFCAAMKIYLSDEETFSLQTSH